MFEYSLAKDSVSHERDIYNALDFIGDVGGLYGGLTGISQTLIAMIALFINNPLNLYLVNSIYHLGGEEESGRPGSDKPGFFSKCRGGR